MTSIKTNGITILLVEEEKGAIDYGLRDNGKTISFGLANGISRVYYPLPQGDWKILGKSTELSEEQMKEICEECDRSKMNLRPYQSTPYKNYLSDGSSSFSGDDTWFKWNVQESYLSMLEANGIVDRNPISDEQKNVDRFWQVEWQEAQSKVKHYLVLKRI